MTLPTRQDINVHDSLDERMACEHFLGKSLAEAEALFREASLTYQEDLMFMGASAFRFYVQAAISYIQSEAATGDSDIVSCFASILEHRVEYEAEELRPIADRLASICGYIIQPDLAAAGDSRTPQLNRSGSFERSGRGDGAGRRGLKRGISKLRVVE